MGQGVEWVTFHFSLPCVTSAGQAAGSIAPHCTWCTWSSAGPKLAVEGWQRLQQQRQRSASQR